MRWRRLLGGFFLCIPAGLAAVIALQPATPFTRSEIQARVAALWRYGAIEVPHQMAPSDDPARPLMARVAAGEVLDAAESATYRRAMQAVLADHQRLFAALDNNLCLASNAGDGTQNNVGGTGIAGQHDLHAASAVSNFDEMQADLTQLAAAGPMRKIYLANEAYKNLTDLMVHLAPAMHSVVVARAPALSEGGDPTLARSFTAFQSAMTEASFADINSAAYLTAVTNAQRAYADLVGQVQTQITHQLSPLEHKIAGRWLAIQGIQPRLTLSP